MKRFRTALCSVATTVLLVGCSGGSGVSQKTDEQTIAERFKPGSYTAVAENTGDYTGYWMITRTGELSTASGSEQQQLRSLVAVRLNDSDYSLQECRAASAVSMAFSDQSVAFTLNGEALTLTVTNENTLTGTMVLSGGELQVDMIKVAALDADDAGSFTLLQSSSMRDETHVVNCFTETLVKKSSSNSVEQTLRLGNVSFPLYGFVTAFENQSASATTGSISIQISANDGGTLDQYSVFDAANIEITKTLVSDDGIQLTLRGAIGESNEFSSAVTASF